MTEERNDHQQYDSADEFEKPKDEFMFYYKAYKVEEKRIYQHQKFEEITAKYWQLLRQQTEYDVSEPTIRQSQYTGLMKRIYKVLLPLYREDEMESEISQEWLMDSRGQPGLTFNLFTKLLFRIAHQWATHIDIEEYISLLNKIYERITQICVYSQQDGQDMPEELYRPIIQVTFPAKEKQDDEENFGVEDQGVKNDDWLECRSDESSRSEYEYRYEEDPENMVVKKYKKFKDQFALGADGSSQTVIKDPFIYEEEVTYAHKKLEQQFQTYRLLDIQYIVPFGYPTEQYLQRLKNDVHLQVEKARVESKRELARKQREVRETGKHMETTAVTGEVDPGLIEEKQGSSKQESFQIASNSRNAEVTVFVSVQAELYNSFRKLLKEGLQMSLRMHSIYPKPGARTKARSTLLSNEPLTEVNKFGYNPSLERRILYKLVPNYKNQNEQHYVNVQYILLRADNEAAFRSDVNKIETKQHMSLKVSDEVQKEEEYVNVETSFKKMRQVMLTKKFESIFSDRCSADTKEQKRLQKTIDKEEKRKQAIMKPGNIANNGLSETYEEKTIIKMIKGPFYKLDSKQGMLEDDFVTMAEHDLIDAACTLAHRIIVLGKPRSGKTTLAKNLATKLELVHINVENWIKALLDKIANYEPPEDLEEGQEPPKFLTDLEETVSEALKNGSGPSDEQTIEIYRAQINSSEARMKGYILDLHFYQRQKSWLTTISQEKLLGTTEDGQKLQFSHVIELDCEDEEIKLRASHMRTDPESGALYSRWEREERKKPKPVSEEEEEEIDEENEIKPLDEFELVQRVNDMEEGIAEELQNYNKVEKSTMDEILMGLFDNQYIKIDSAGLTPDELTDCVACRIQPDEDQPLRPLGVLVEGGSDFKSLLTEGLEEGQIPRKWSLWKQTDPVALRQGQVIQGSPEYAVSYSNNMFVFSTEENMKAFQQEPKVYLQQLPSMPAIFRILMLGPEGSGRHVQAQRLSEIYGWKIVDFKEVIRRKIEELVSVETHIPNNPVEGGRIGMNEQELQDVIEGKPFPAWKYIPWIFEFLGFELEKKRPPPPEQKENEEEENEEEEDEEVKKKKELEAKKKKDEEEKKRKEEEEVQRAKEERKQRRDEAIEQGLDLEELGLEEEEEEVIVIEDLSIDDLSLKIDESTGKTPFVGGFIMVGFPETEEHINKLKESGIDFDRIIYLNDTNEEEPGVEIKKRMMEDDSMYDWEWQNENAQRILGLAKEHLNEENVREISCNGGIDEVLIRIRNEIDPFYLKVDNPDDVRVTADLGEEERKLPKGDFGDYCPVTYVKDNWLVKGNPEFEATVYGKTFIFAGEKEAEEFKLNPQKFLVTFDDRQQLPLQPPPPKIMILGAKGAGITTQIRMLCDKFKLEEFNLKEEYLRKLSEEKEKRKRRRLLDRGFRPPQPAEEEDMEPPVDPEIEDDPEDFDKEAHEREVMQMILDSGKGLVIDGTWTDLPEDTVGQSLQDLLVESRRVPEIIIMLQCKEQTTFNRMIDADSIKATYDRLMQERSEEQKKQREEDRQKRLEELNAEEEEKTPEEIQEEMDKWDEERDAEDEAADENDAEKPNHEEMLDKEKETLKERREKDETFMEEFGTALKEKGVTVIDDLKADVSADYVFIKLLDKIKDNFSLRKDIIEKEQAQSLTIEEVPFYEKSYIFKGSKFGPNCPLYISNPTKTKKHSVLYRERIYYLSNPEMQQKFLKEPSRFTIEAETIPLDINITPKIVVLGLPKSGKSTLCHKLVENTGAVHLKMSKIAESFMDKDSVQSNNLRKTAKVEGKHLEDEMLVNLLYKRIQFKDCQTKGWVLEDFPKTRYQAILMAKKSLVPTNVFQMMGSVSLTYKRTEATADSVFGHNRVFLNQRLDYIQSNLPFVLSFYQRYYNNVCEIDTTKSKWFVEDRSMRELQLHLEAKQNFARDYHLRDTSKRGCKMMHLNMDRSLAKQSLSLFKYCCPVSWRNEKLIVRSGENIESCVLYNNAFYFFRGTKERDMFLSNPSRFLINHNFPKQEDLSIRFWPHKPAEIVTHEKSLNGHCAVTLMDEERATKGDPVLMVQYKGSKYIFDTEFKLQRFYQNPFKYSKATLPVKMPPADDKVPLFSLSKMDDSITYMEQSLGQIVTRALREVSENRLKYPKLSVKETMLKLFALFLKMENPANTEFMKDKYSQKIREFIECCELPEEIFDLAEEKDKKKGKGGWAEFKESYYNQLGATYDSKIKAVDLEKAENFSNYSR